MARGARIEVKGLKELKKKFGSIPKDVADEVDAAMAVAANDFENRAASAAPVNLGQLKGAISSNRIKEMDWEVVSPLDYSAFVEFGTRTRVQVPADLQSYAAQFKSGGNKGDAKKAIYEWCRLKGIEEKYWYPIYIKVMTVGINPHPFFFIQRGPVYKQLVKNCKEAIKRALSK
jgi:HK97 gp10 family phage protein